MTDRYAGYTPSQQAAITTVGTSILVSAAAGSGKTTVLAERCAHLVCDLRCPVDRLLVVTFTDAAAAEMKSRIAGAIRRRIEGAGDEWLREQLYLLDSASISTIHSFCKTIVQKWFPQAGIDPQARVLAGEEAQLLREETLDALAVELYAGSDELATGFQALLDDYGAGSDYLVRETLLSLHDFINSLPDPDAWLDHTLAANDLSDARCVLARLDELQWERLAAELDGQIEYGEAAAETIRVCWPVAAGLHAAGIEEHVLQLRAWREALGRKPTGWRTVAADIGAFEFERAGSRSRKLSEEDKAAYACAKGLRDETKKLFYSRLQDACCRFTAEEYREGLERIAPYVRTFVTLVRRFDERYRQAKAELAALDFNDLQRYALRLLTDENDATRPSDVARQLQAQYEHVLVDEFQDIDPLQETILRMVSRECADPPQGNLFTVGDIKQSIYRFRLAEPELFQKRSEMFDAGRGGQSIPLSENFRSRSGIIDAVNAIFRPLMSRDFGGTDYTGPAELKAGAKYPPDAPGRFDRPAVELHLLEPVTQQTARNGDENGDEDAETPTDDLDGLEREAFIIATRIEEWMGRSGKGRHFEVADKPNTPGGEPTVRPLAYRDIVILLRSMQHKAGPIADILRRKGIPVRIEGQDAGFETTEFRDISSLLALLDNAQQDLPLAAVLRSPLLGRPFTEGELLEFRLARADGYFHQAVAAYAEHGADSDLRERLRGVLATITRYRQRVQCTPVAEVLWEIYHDHGYMGYVAGLPDGHRRREHLIRLHELARQFGQFSRQGLRRFLCFLEDMQARELAPSAASTAGSDDDVVRIMTIHASKGLEFPVVFVADLQKTFNITDISSTVLFDRQLGIAMRAADPQRHVTYPTLVHQLAAEKRRRENLAEELRVLYVALTRAREHLVLVGRIKPDKLGPHQMLQKALATVRRLPRLEKETARCMLDWLLPAVAACPAELVAWPGEDDADRRALFRIHIHDRAETDRWRIPPPVQTERVEDLQRIARFEPLPDAEPLIAFPPLDLPGRGVAADEAMSQRLVDVAAGLDFVYPGLELTTTPARVSVTELKRRWEAMQDPDEQRRERVGYRTNVPRPVFMEDADADDPLARGTATHRFLQLVDLTAGCDAANLAQQLDAMVAAGRLSEADAGVVELDACTWFFGTELGRSIRASATRVQREVAFVGRIPCEAYDPLLTARDGRDVLLIRGMVDVLVRRPEGLEILDYKTDRVTGADLATRAQAYRPQVDSYATAMQGIYQQPVLSCWLVFLHGRRIVHLPSGRESE